MGCDVFLELALLLLPLAPWFLLTCKACDGPEGSVVSLSALCPKLCVYGEEAHTRYPKLPWVQIVRLPAPRSADGLQPGTSFTRAWAMQPYDALLNHRGASNPRATVWGDPGV